MLTYLKNIDTEVKQMIALTVGGLAVLAAITAAALYFDEPCAGKVEFSHMGFYWVVGQNGSLGHMQSYPVYHCVLPQ